MSTLTRHAAPGLVLPADPLPAHAPVRERLLALDVFRGATIAAMLLVNEPGSWGAIYPPLEHARWNGWTPTGLIFPFFLFIVGITTHLSLAARRRRGASERSVVRQIAKRGLLIVAVGLLLSGFPYAAFDLRLPFGIHFDSLTPLLDLAHWRFTGVLQRIGIAYLAAGLLTLRTPLRTQVAIIAAILLGYWMAITLIPVPGYGLGALTLNRPDATLGAWVDRTVFGTRHLWKGSVTWDPEGLLSTVPAIATTMLGVLAGRWIAERRPLLERISGLFAAGSIAMVIGLTWNWVLPINKNLWTSSYVLFTAGAACATLATCLWLTDVLRVTGWAKPLVIFGLNPIFAYVASEWVARLLYTLIRVPYGGTLIPLQEAIYRAGFASWLPPVDASLFFAVAAVLLWFVLLWVLYRRDIVIKV